MNPVDDFVCSECGRAFEDSLNAYDKDEDGYHEYYEYEPLYCPHCGRKVIKE